MGLAVLRSVDKLDLCVNWSIYFNVKAYNSGSKWRSKPFRHSTHRLKAGACASSQIAFRGRSYICSTTEPKQSTGLKSHYLCLRVRCFRIGCFTASYPLHSRVFWSFPYCAVTLHESHTEVASRSLTRNLTLHRYSNIFDDFCQVKKERASSPT